MSKLSIIIPVYYNERNLPVTYAKLKEEVLNKVDNYELILVDDGSGDNSYKIMQNIRDSDNRVKLVKLSRNFGSITAQLAGLKYATGDCATIIAADLQDPPEIILRLFEKWNSGSKVCLAVRSDRQEGFVQKTISNIFYRIMRKVALKDMPVGGFDCFLIDRQVVDIIKSTNEKNSSIVGQVIWCGFKPEKVFYTRVAREIGKISMDVVKKNQIFY